MHSRRTTAFQRSEELSDRLEWDVSVSGDMEVDPFDALRPVHLVQLSETGSVVGCVRFLPTTGPTMLANTFPALLDGGEPPRDPRIFESSRFCVDTAQANEAGTRGLRQATSCLFTAMIEWGLTRDLSCIVNALHRHRKDDVCILVRHGRCLLLWPKEAQVQSPSLRPRFLAGVVKGERREIAASDPR